MQKKNNLGILCLATMTECSVSYIEHMVHLFVPTNTIKIIITVQYAMLSLW